jgi:hypothetical protein
MRHYNNTYNEFTYFDITTYTTYYRCHYLQGISLTHDANYKKHICNVKFINFIGKFIMSEVFIRNVVSPMKLNLSSMEA